MNLSRRQHLRQLAIGAAASLFSMSALSNTLKNAPALQSARVLSGFAPGGTIDIMARRAADGLNGQYAKSVFVDSRPGAGGQIAISTLKAAKPDGATLLATPMSMLCIYPYTYKSLPYDPVADLTPVSQAANVDMGFAVGPMVPASVTNVPEFLAWCKANPNLANFGCAAPGSVPHFLGILIGREGNVDLQSIGFRGAQPAITDLLGGQIASVSSPLGEFLPHLAGGKLRVLATSGATRSPFLKDVPTLAEQGYKNLVYSEWFGFFLPGNASATTVEQANAAIRQALAAPALIEGLGLMGMEARSSTPAELAAMIKADLDRWGPIVNSIGFSANA